MELDEIGIDVKAEQNVRYHKKGILISTISGNRAF